MVLNPIVNEGILRVSSENNRPRLTAHVIPFFGLNDDSLILEFRKSGCFHGGLLFDLGLEDIFTVQFKLQRSKL